MVNRRPPDPRDFRSQADKGWIAPAGATEEQVDASFGISAWETFELARTQASGMSYRFIAEIRVTDGGPIRYRKTFGPGHWTLWGSPQDFLAAVVDTYPV